jgi:hypothetical protein
VKTFRDVGDVKNGTADLWTKGNLRDKRRDPWPRANALPEAAADLELAGEDAEMKGSGTQGRGNAESARRRQRQKSAPNDQVAARRRKHGGVQIKQRRKAAREMTGGRRAGERRC